MQTRLAARVEPRRAPSRRGKSQSQLSAVRHTRFQQVTRRLLLVTMHCDALVSYVAFMHELPPGLWTNGGCLLTGYALDSCAAGAALQLANGVAKASKHVGLAPLTLMHRMLTDIAMRVLSGEAIIAARALLAQGGRWHKQLEMQKVQQLVSGMRCARTPVATHAAVPAQEAEVP